MVVSTLADVVQQLPLAAPRLSLLASIPVHEGPEADARVIEGSTWRENALEFLPEPFGLEGGVFDPTIGVVVDISGDKSTIAPKEHFQGFGVYEPESVSTFTEAIDPMARAGRAISLDEAKQVEFELWTGTQAQAAGWTTNRWLARNVAGPGGNPQAAQQLNGGAATTPIRALGDLEMAAADGRSGGRCIIHATLNTIQYWFNNHLLYRQGNVLLTVGADTLVVAGQGYPGTAPDGSLPAAHDHAWAYVTGPIEAFRGPVEIIQPAAPEVTDLNRRTAIARRHYALVVDPAVHSAVQVTHT